MLRRARATSGVDYDDVDDTLEREGVQKFADSFDELLDGIRAKRGELVSRLREWRPRRRSSSSGSGPRPDASGPATTRRSGSAGSTSRCGCASASTSCSTLASTRRTSTTSSCSGWAARASRPRCCGGRSASERFHVLDTTHPTAIRRSRRDRPRAARSSSSSSKSGSTLETRSHTRLLLEAHGRRGGRFVAITDPGSRARGVRARARLRAVFPGEPTIGGRYSALSPFGLVPAALMGVDLARLLDRAEEMREACRLDEGNPGLELGLALGEGWREGRDKVCVRARRLRPLGRAADRRVDRQGRQGPRPGRASRRTAPTCSAGGAARATPYELGQEFFRWEFATAVAGSILGINPFDQPDVQAAKDRTNELLARGGEPPARAGRLRRRAARRRARGRLRRDPGVRRPRARRRSSRRSSSARARDRLRRHARARPALPALDRASCTRAARTPASSSRSSTTSARSCRSRAATSASAA